LDYIAVGLNCGGLIYSGLNNSLVYFWKDASLSTHWIQGAQNSNSFKNTWWERERMPALQPAMPLLCPPSPSAFSLPSFLLVLVQRSNWVKPVGHQQGRMHLAM